MVWWEWSRTGLGWEVDQRCMGWWFGGLFVRGVFSGFKAAESGDVLIELGVGHTVNVGDVSVVSEDAFYNADDWFVSGWYAGCVWIVGVRLKLALPTLSYQLDFDPTL